MRSRYTTLFERLVANTEQPENDTGCRLWKRKKDRWGYGQLNVWVPGVGAPVTMKAHIALWCWIEAECTTADDLYLAYTEMQAAGMELDHGCVTPSCCNPDCLTLVTPQINCKLREARRRGAMHAELQTR